MTRGKVSPQQAVEIAELRERGWSYERIASKFTISTGAVHYHCLKQGAVSPRTRPAAEGPREFIASDGRRQRRFTPEEDARMLRLSAEGKSAWAIAGAIGRAYSSVTIRLMTLALHDMIAEEAAE